MKISYNWLKQFINTDWDAKQTGELLTDLGLEIEGITPFSSVPGGLKGIVVGHVLSCEQHQNADRLKVTKVDLGADEIVQIVCGAPNVAAGQKVPVATIGTTLYDADGKPWQIKKGKAERALKRFKTQKEAKKFIHKMVKPDYNWADNEDIEQRFMSIVERKFL